MDNSLEEIFNNFLSGFVNLDNIRIYDIKIHEMPLQKRISLIINFNDLKEFNELLTNTLMEYPRTTINSFNEILFEKLKSIDPDYAFIIKNCFVRITNLSSDAINLRKIRSIHLNKFINVKGIVVRTTSVKPQLSIARFRCNSDSCNELIDVIQLNNKFTKPRRCTNPSCNNTNSFTFLPKDSMYQDWQKIRIQETPEELPAGQLPRHIESILLNDLVDTVRPGDRVIINGIIETMQDYGKQGKLTTFNPFLYANYIDKTEKDEEIESWDEEEEKELKTLSKREDLFEVLTSIVAPNISGYKVIKKAIILLLFSGVRKILPNNISIRGDVHILLVGDPGAGKSQLLKGCVGIAPRGLYTSGKGSSQAGLTAAVVSDSDTRERTLEAGALVIADKGVCAIDEFTQMNENDRRSIHEAMEQQSISIHKAGINATLNARTSILASANPTYGRYDDLKSIKDNIRKLSPVILTRFDLIFKIQDKPETKKDEKISGHMLNIHQNRTVSTQISTDLFKKYIYYARNTCDPRLSNEAVDIIQKFYLDTRDSSAYADDEDAPVPITARYLESIIRLSEARAKIELSKIVTKEHAEEAINLLKYSLTQVGMDKESGQLDIDSIEAGVTKSRRNRVESLLSLIQSMVLENNGDGIKKEDLIKEAEKLELSENQVNDSLKILKEEGLIYNPSFNVIKNC